VRTVLNGWFWDQPATGSGQYLRQLLQAMGPVVAETKLLICLPHGNSVGDVPPVETHWLPIPKRWLGRNMAKVWFEQVAFPRAARRLGADVAHVPYWGSSLWPRVPTVVTLHDLIPRVLPAYRGGPWVRLYTALVSHAVHRAAQVLCDSDASRQDALEWLRLDPTRVHAVHLAVGNEFSPEPAPADAEVRARYELPPRYVLYLGGHDVRKNVAGLLRAFSLVAPSDAEVSLVVGGRLPQRSSGVLMDPRPLAAELGLEAEVRFLGWVPEEDKPALYRGAACFVFPSRYEGFGLPVLEALACGTPVVTSDCSSLPEVIGGAGYSVSPDDIRGLAGAILSILVDDELAADLAGRGPAQAARFSWRQTAKRTLSVYAQAVGEDTVRRSGQALREG
jgi:glycosyltransferase involved in cell wall biosynthesis